MGCWAPLSRLSAPCTTGARVLSASQAVTQTCLVTKGPVNAFCGWCGPVGYTSPWPPALAGSVRSWVRSGRNENQHLQIWGHGSRLIKGGAPSLGRGGDPAPGGGDEVPRSLVHEWGENGWQADRCSNCSDEDSVPVVVKRELRQKAKLSIYWSIFVPTLRSRANKTEVGLPKMKHGLFTGPYSSPCPPVKKDRNIYSFNYFRTFSHIFFNLPPSYASHFIPFQIPTLFTEGLLLLRCVKIYSSAPLAST